MKLYSSDLSNFAAKCRIVIREKQAPVEVVPVPGGDLKSPEYLAIFPAGLIPTLDTGSQVIGESQAIAEYLEERFPEPALLPSDAEGRARARFLAAYHDGSLEPHLRACYPQLTAKQRDQALLDERLGVVNARLDALESFWSEGPYALGDAFSLADCALAPTGTFLEAFLPRLGAKPWTEQRAKLARWWKTVQERPSVAEVLGSQRAALRARFGG